MWNKGNTGKQSRILSVIFIVVFIVTGLCLFLLNKSVADSTVYAATKKELCISLPDKVGNPAFIALSPDGKKLIVCNKTQIFRLSVSEHPDIETIDYKGISISSVIYSNSGRYIAFIDNQKSGFYDFNKSKYHKFPIDYYYYQPDYINFTKDDRYLMAGAATKENGNQIVLINTEDGKIVKRVNVIPSPDVMLAEGGNILYTLRSCWIDKNWLGGRGKRISINLLSGSLNEEINKDVAIFRKESFSDWTMTINALKLRKNKGIKRIYELMPIEAKKIIDSYQSGSFVNEEMKAILVDGFNKILTTPDFCNDKALWSLTLSNSDRKKYKNGLAKLNIGEIMLFNRTLIEHIGIGEIKSCGYLTLKNFPKFFDNKLQNLILIGNGKIYTSSIADDKYSYIPIPHKQYADSFIKSSCNSRICMSEQVYSKKPDTWVYVFDYGNENPELLKVWTEGPFTMSPSGNYIAYLKRKQVVVSRIPDRSTSGQ